MAAVTDRKRGRPGVLVLRRAMCAGAVVSHADRRVSTLPVLTAAGGGVWAADEGRCVMAAGVLVGAFLMAFSISALIALAEDRRPWHCAIVALVGGTFAAG